MKKAIFSVCNKTGILDFARELSRRGFELLATRGTCTFLQEGGVTAQPIDEFTGVPELLDGKVKTLHPKIFAEILSDDPSITCVVVNLYPDKIDIGGSALLRAAAKNYEKVLVLCDPNDYGEALLSPDRKKLAAKAFRLTAAYDAKIAAELESVTFPEKLTLSYTKSLDLAYGENPDQRAALYLEGEEVSQQLQGKPLTFNNLLDADAAFELVKKFSEPSCVIVKHNNPCGAATRADALLAFEQAYAADPLCAFGGVVAFNCPVDLATMRTLEKKFIEVVIAPSFDEEALKGLQKKTMRVLLRPIAPGPSIQFKQIGGGLLYQTNPGTTLNWKVVTKKQPTQEQIRDLLFAWTVCGDVKSNTIVLAKEKKTIGIGAGQMSRVDSTYIALYKAKEQAIGSVLASDGFFPFADSIEMAAEARISAIIQPGGSKKDSEVIEACNRYGIAMVFTGKRQFRH